MLLPSGKTRLFDNLQHQIRWPRYCIHLSGAQGRVHVFLSFSLSWIASGYTQEIIIELSEKKNLGQFQLLFCRSDAGYTVESQRPAHHAARVSLFTLGVKFSDS